MMLRLCLGLGAAVLAAPALADEYIAFQSPTGNIHCALHEYGGTTEARCVMREYQSSFRSWPPGCEGLNREFAVWDFRDGQLSCSDASLTQDTNPVLPYGNAVSLGGISCVSAKTGMTCTNADGHGFSVARAKQRLF